MKKRVADIIFDTLVERKITKCFAVVGGGAMHLDNALGHNDSIEKVFNHHEQACSMAAEAYAKASGEMAAVCVTSGPGATNAITGVMGAWEDSIPMIVISGQVRYETSVESSGLNLRYRGVQEFEIIESVKNMTKYSIKLKDPLACKEEVNKAIDIALAGRRGPVWIDVPLNIQSAVIDTEDLYENEVYNDTLYDFTEVDEVFDRLTQAKRPVIIAGTGISNSGCRELFRRFISKNSIPIVSTLVASDVLPITCDCFYGPAGTIGPRPGNFILQNADVILAIGSSIGFQLTGFNQEEFAKKAYIISVDVDENEVKKPGIHISRHICCTIESFLTKAVDENRTIIAPTKWTEYCIKLKRLFSPYAPGMNSNMAERVNAYWFWNEFDRIMPDNIVYVLGNNSANSIRLQIGVPKWNQRLITNKNCGSMGFDLPASIGASISGKSVVCLTGDGSIMMNLQEFQTIKHNNLPIKIVIMANDGYNAMRQTSLNFFNGFFVGCNSESGISFPPFKKVAELFGFNYICCRCNGEVTSSVEQFKDSKDNVILEVLQRLDDPITPKVMSRQLEDGTMLSPALHDMYPFLPKEMVDELMRISE